MDYDAIVIGSGAGGLTAAVALAQAGKSTIGQVAGRIPSRSMATASAPARTTAATCMRAGTCGTFMKGSACRRI